MMVMVTNNSSGRVHYLAGRYESARLLGHLYSPDGWRRPYPWLPYALDNGAYGAWVNGRPFDEAAFMGLCDRAAASEQPPLWVVVPDAVGDRDTTLRQWDSWAPRLTRAYGWTLALAVQDGMTAADVPAEAGVVFVGGTTQWKRRTIHEWCAGRRAHVGRINTERWLWYCWRAGAESCDGTGWFRGCVAQLAGLENYLARAADGRGPDPRIESRDLFGYAYGK